ncbi:Serine/threonine-protein kinase Nek2 [Terramyces sp. JEL0728]|nr:Serine/threonine-protein kinase Nek2 [Terramyces sp. JEL0728]KAJ3276569.1 Serine/threonine-protein kinase Nek2 [Terramyces sp. JEL0728]
MGWNIANKEYCEGGDLAGIIKRCRKEKQFIPEDVIWNLFAQLALALNECHKDIKPENVFLDKFLNVKLGDFGLSRQISPGEEFAKTYVGTMVRNLGTPYYMSPELVDELPYNAKSDVWALGCLIYELCALE